ncbi:unnamed protein product [Acanthoscelides obtectus]|uniref:Uncharacterized protein n=1 Tax=Acanthoscelides obtectus TaxID=200917 RepID=A0A9P0LT28_ACAOB|nr:unnamed protein product [Acanthoscelides obtectus]CAK1634018.1 hypothetical protein AOBTE_LOCUS8540 [Acanthoscelides obtectus]
MDKGRSHMVHLIDYVFPFAKIFFSYRRKTIFQILFILNIEKL